MSAFVVAVSVEGRRCLVVGGDAEALAKARRLRACGARLELYAEAPDEALSSWAEAEGVALHRRRPADDDLRPRPAVVVSSPRDEALSSWLHARALGEGFLLCCIDQPAWSNFAHTAVADAGTVTVALASGGTAPMLLRRLRDGIAAGLGDDFADFTRYLAALRAATDPSQRRKAIGEALEGLRVELAVTLPPTWRARWERLRLP